MLLLVTDLLDGTTVDFQTGFCGEKAVQNSILDGQDLGGGVGRGAVQGTISDMALLRISW